MWCYLKVSKLHNYRILFSLDLEKERQVMYDYL